MKPSLYCTLFAGILLNGCIDFHTKPKGPGNVTAWVPVYRDANTPEPEIAVHEPRNTTSGGKIFAYGQQLLQVETGHGIHIIDYSDKQHPKKLGFITIPGCGEVALKGMTLYTNSFDELVVIDISKYPDVVVKSRKANVFPEMSGWAPPESGYFVCPDRSRGRVIKWETKTVNNPQCRN